MGRSKVTVKQSAADNIAAIAWFIESKGMIATADKFVDAAYDFFIALADDIKSYPICREPAGQLLATNAFRTKINTLLYLLKQQLN